jgi:hypothetical protein
MSFAIKVKTVENKESENTIAKYVIEPDIKHQSIDNFGHRMPGAFNILGNGPKKNKKNCHLAFSTETTRMETRKGLGYRYGGFILGPAATNKAKKA